LSTGTIEYHFWRRGRLVLVVNIFVQECYSIPFLRNVPPKVDHNSIYHFPLSSFKFCATFTAVTMQRSIHSHWLFIRSMKILLPDCGPFVVADSLKPIKTRQQLSPSSWAFRDEEPWRHGHQRQECKKQHPGLIVVYCIVALFDFDLIYLIEDSVRLIAGFHKTEGKLRCSLYVYGHSRARSPCACCVFDDSLPIITLSLPHESHKF
jgi:hypothetical protein